MATVGFVGNTPDQQWNAAMQVMNQAADNIGRQRQMDLQRGWDNFWKLAEHSNSPQEFAASPAGREYLQQTFGSWGIDGNKLGETLAALPGTVADMKAAAEAAVFSGRMVSDPNEPPEAPTPATPVVDKQPAAPASTDQVVAASAPPAPAPAAPPPVKQGTYVPNMEPEQVFKDKDLILGYALLRNPEEMIKDGKKVLVWPGPDGPTEDRNLAAQYQRDTTVQAMKRNPREYANAMAQVDALTAEMKQNAKPMPNGGGDVTRSWMDYARQKPGVYTLTLGGTAGTSDLGKAYADYMEYAAPKTSEKANAPQQPATPEMKLREVLNFTYKNQPDMLAKIKATTDEGLKKANPGTWAKINQGSQQTTTPAATPAPAPAPAVPVAAPAAATLSPGEAARARVIAARNGEGTPSTNGQIKPSAGGGVTTTGQPTPQEAKETAKASGQFVADVRKAVNGYTVKETSRMDGWSKEFRASNLSAAQFLQDEAVGKDGKPIPLAKAVAQRLTDEDKYKLDIVRSQIDNNDAQSKYYAAQTDAVRASMSKAVSIMDTRIKGFRDQLAIYEKSPTVISMKTALDDIAKKNAGSADLGKLLDAKMNSLIVSDKTGQVKAYLDTISLLGAASMGKVPDSVVISGLVNGGWFGIGAESAEAAIVKTPDMMGGMQQKGPATGPATAQGQGLVNKYGQ